MSFNRFASINRIGRCRASTAARSGRCGRAVSATPRLMSFSSAIISKFRRRHRYERLRRHDRRADVWLRFRRRRMFFRPVGLSSRRKLISSPAPTSLSPAAFTSTTKTFRAALTVRRSSSILCTSNGYHQQIAIDNNMMIGNGSFVLEVLGNAAAPGSARVIFRHNTTYGNGLSGVGTPSEISIIAGGTLVGAAMC